MILLALLQKDMASASIVETVPISLACLPIRLTGTDDPRDLGVCPDGTLSNGVTGDWTSRIGLLADVATAISDMNIQMSSVISTGGKRQQHDDRPGSEPAQCGTTRICHAALKTNSGRFRRFTCSTLKAIAFIISVRDRYGSSYSKSLPGVCRSGRRNGRRDSKGFVVLSESQRRRREDADLLADKICGLRIFTDEQDKMNLALADVGGSILAISNFTLLADATHGRRPNFMNAQLPQQADELYRHFVRKCRLTESDGNRCVWRAHEGVD